RPPEDLDRDYVFDSNRPLSTLVKEDNPMTRFQVCTLLLSALVLSAVVGTLGRSEQVPGAIIPASSGGKEQRQTSTTTAENGFVYAIYALSELGEDPSLGVWATETIPTVIRPGTWVGTPAGTPQLRHHGAAKVLVVYHCPAVQAEVGAFLNDLKKT